MDSDRLRDTYPHCQLLFLPGHLLGHCLQLDLALHPEETLPVEPPGRQMDVFTLTFCQLSSWWLGGKLGESGIKALERLLGSPGETCRWDGRLQAILGLWWIHTGPRLHWGSLWDPKLLPQNWSSRGLGPAESGQWGTSSNRRHFQIKDWILDSPSSRGLSSLR